MSNLDPRLQKMLNEWERLVLAGVAMVLLIAVGVVGLKLVGFQSDSRPTGGGSAPQPRFSEGSFAFLDRDGMAIDLPADHAFTLPPGTQIKRTSRPQPPPVQVVRQDPPDKEPAPDSNDDSEEPRLTEVNVPPPPTKNPPKDPVKPPPKVVEAPPEPETKDFITYKGFMDVDGKAKMAYVQHVHDPGRGREQRSTAFMAPGEALLGWTVVEFAEEYLVVKKTDGTTQKIQKGARVRVQESAAP